MVCIVKHLARTIFFYKNSDSLLVNNNVELVN